MNRANNLVGSNYPWQTREKQLTSSPNYQRLKMKIAVDDSQVAS